MSARPENNVVRGIVVALLPAVAAWLVMAIALVALVLWLPQSIGLTIAAVLIIGPLVVAAFRRT